MEKLYEAKESETCLNTTAAKMNVTIQIDDQELTRSRKSFSETGIERLKSVEDHRVLHCERLNDMPLEIFDMILKQTSWLMWVCFLIETLRPCSTTPMTKYLEEGIRGFSNFVSVSSSDIYRELSLVCAGWRNLLQDERYGKSIRSELLSRITKKTIKTSKKILIECLDVHDDGLLDLFLNEKLITTEEKKDCESMPEKSSKIFLGILCRVKTQPFAKLLKFLRLLEKQCKSHLVNHVISFGVHWSKFEKKWPLDEQTKLIIVAWSHVISFDMSVRYVVTVDMLFEESISYDLVQALFENNYITVEKRNQFNQSQDPQKTKILMKLLKHGSVELFEIAIDYFKLTDQGDTADMLQLHEIVNLGFEHIVSCLHGAEEILKSMAEKSRLVSSLLKKFSNTVHSNRLNRFRKNELLLTIINILDPDLNMLFINFLMTSKQHSLLIPMLKDDSHSEVIKEYESYLIDSIDADNELLFKLVDLKVINRTKMRAIFKMETSMKRKKKMLSVISKASHKSFNLFLTVVAQPCRSNIHESMHPEQCKSSKYDSCVASSSVADRQVEMVAAETAKETHSFNFIDTEPYVDCIDSDEDLKDSDEVSQPLKFETDPEIELSLEKKRNSGSMNRNNSWSTSDLSRF